MKRVLVILSAVLLIAATTLSGCAASGGAKLKEADVLTKSYDAMQAVKAFHFTMDHSTGGTPIGSGLTMTKAEGDIVRPDKLSIKLKGTSMLGAVEVSLISAGGETKMTNPLNGGKWETVPDMFKVLTVFDPGKGIGGYH